VTSGCSHGGEGEKALRQSIVEMRNFTVHGGALPQAAASDYLGTWEPWAISACMVLPSELMRAIGPMDEVFNPIGCEDVDYCFRVRARGRKVMYKPDVEIYHAENTSTFGTPKLDIRRLMKRNQRIMKRRWSHMFPTEPSIKDLPLIHSGAPRVPLWMMNSLPTL
jgi:GT2 family glycosyltransferase